MLAFLASGCGDFCWETIHYLSRPSKERSIIQGYLELNSVSPPYNSSLWWRENCRVGVGLDFGLDWFLDSVVKKIGNEGTVCF